MHARGFGYTPSPIPTRSLKRDCFPFDKGLRGVLREFRGCRVVWDCCAALHVVGTGMLPNTSVFLNGNYHLLTARMFASLHAPMNTLCHSSFHVIFHIILHPRSKALSPDEARLVLRPL